LLRWYGTTFVKALDVGSTRAEVVGVVGRWAGEERGRGGHGWVGALRRRVTLVFAGCRGEPGQSRMTILRREGTQSVVASPDAGKVLSHSAIAFPPDRA